VAYDGEQELVPAGRQTLGSSLFLTPAQEPPQLGADVQELLEVGVSRTRFDGDFDLPLSR